MAVIEGSRPRPLVKAGVPSGTDFAGEAPTGAVCVDSETGAAYVNTGTRDVPVWTRTTTAA